MERLVGSLMRWQEGGTSGDKRAWCVEQIHKGVLSITIDWRNSDGSRKFVRRAISDYERRHVNFDLLAYVWDKLYAEFIKEYK